MNRVSFALRVSIAVVMIWSLDNRVLAQAAAYRVTDLGIIGGLGGVFSDAMDINEHGVVTGQAYTLDDPPTSRAFIYDGSMQILGASFGRLSRGFAINNSNTVTGLYYPNSSDYQAFISDGGGTPIAPANSVGWDINDFGHVTGELGDRAFLYDGTVRDLGTLGGGKSGGRGINELRAVTGYASLADGATHAFLYDGTMHDLGTLGGGYSLGADINNAGHAVGVSSLIDGTFHAFLYDGVTMHDLGTLGGESGAGGINSHDHVVGASHRRAFLWTKADGMVDLNTLIDPQSGWLLKEAQSINDRGQIVGNGLVNGRDHGFLLTPIPEPLTTRLFAGGVLAFGLWRRARD
jgi:probable HAF family extracellular repeat protein